MFTDNSANHPGVCTPHHPCEHRNVPRSCTESLDRKPPTKIRHLIKLNLIAEAHAKLPNYFHAPRQAVLRRYSCAAMQSRWLVIRRVRLLTMRASHSSMWAKVTCSRAHTCHFCECAVAQIRTSRKPTSFSRDTLFHCATAWSSRCLYLCFCVPVSFSLCLWLDVHLCSNAIHLYIPYSVVA